MSDSERTTGAGGGGGGMVPGESGIVSGRLQEVLDRSRQDLGMIDLLQAIEAVHNSLKVDAAYLAEALISEQRLTADLKRRVQTHAKTEADAVRQATLKEHQADRLHNKVLTLEKAIEEAELRGEADRLMAITERDTAIENMSAQIRALEAENGRLSQELAELKQNVRPLDLTKERYADPAVLLVVDGDELVLRAWGSVPLSIGRSRAIALLSRLAEDREARVEVVFGTPEGLKQDQLDQAPVRVRVISNGVPMGTALAKLQQEYEDQVEVAVATDHVEVVGPVPVTRIVELLGMPSSTGQSKPITNLAANG